MLKTETRVLVTGASGFIGANLVQRLAREGYPVRVLLRKTAHHPFLATAPVERVDGDITDIGSVQTALAGCRYVFHAAAHISFNRSDRPRLYRTNVEGTRIILEGALRSGIRRFIHVSACAVFGSLDKKDAVLDETSPAAVSEDNVYAYSKRLAEEEVMRSCDQGLDCVIANPCTVYGQGDKTLNSGSLIKAVYSGRLRFMPPGGTSYVSVDDAVEGLILLMEKGRMKERYILCAENLTYKDLCRRIASALGVQEPRSTLPAFLSGPSVLGVSILESLLGVFNIRPSFLSSQIVSELFRYKYFSPEKSKRELGWSPRVSLEESVRRAFDFYRAEGLV